MRGAFKPEPIVQFLCQQKGVQDLAQINPYAGCSMPAYTLWRPSTAVAELESDVSFQVPAMQPVSNEQVEAARIPVGLPPAAFVQPKQPVVDPSSGKESVHDLQRVCVYGARASWYQSDVELPVLGRLNFVHKGLAEAEETHTVDRLIAEGGGVRGAFIHMHKTAPEGQDTDATALYRRNFHYANPDFIQTMALVTEKNVMNGIVQIPRDVCLNAGLPVFKDGKELSVPDSVLEKLMAGMSLSDAPKDVQAAKKEELRAHLTETMREKIETGSKIEFFVAVPHNHVLAWVLQSDEIRAKLGYRCEQLRIKPAGESDGRVLYFLVPNTTFDAILSKFKETWINKVDMRALSDVALELLPGLVKASEAQLGQAVGGHVKVRLILSYMSAPCGLTDSFIEHLAPVIPPGFVSIDAYNMDRIAAEMAAQRYMERKAQ